jgi:predicted  nucleic acid-binding Zn-ribbon protein
MQNGRHFRDSAKLFVESSTDSRQVRELAAENKSMKEQLDTLTKQIAALTKSKGRAA